MSPDDRARVPVHDLIGVNHQHPDLHRHPMPRPKLTRSTAAQSQTGPLIALLK